MKVVGKAWEWRNLFIEGKLQWLCYARRMHRTKIWRRALQLN